MALPREASQGANVLFQDWADASGYPPLPEWRAEARQFDTLEITWPFPKQAKSVAPETANHRTEKLSASRYRLPIVQGDASRVQLATDTSFDTKLVFRPQDLDMPPEATLLPPTAVKVRQEDLEYARRVGSQAVELRSYERHVERFKARQAVKKSQPSVWTVPLDEAEWAEATLLANDSRLEQDGALNELITGDLTSDGADGVSAKKSCFVIRTLSEAQERMGVILEAWRRKEADEEDQAHRKGRRTQEGLLLKSLGASLKAKAAGKPDPVPKQKLTAASTRPRRRIQNYRTNRVAKVQRGQGRVATAPGGSSIVSGNEEGGSPSGANRDRAGTTLSTSKPKRLILKVRPRNLHSRS